MLKTFSLMSQFSQESLSLQRKRKNLFHQRQRICMLRKILDFLGQLLQVGKVWESFLPLGGKPRTERSSSFQQKRCTQASLKKRFLGSVNSRLFLSLSPWR